MKLLGIHHITAICGAPAPNVAFYTRVLGQRMIKRTVNFDDPGSWHLYYGDSTGSPGTVLTFFPHPGLASGSAGAGEMSVLSYAIPSGTMDYWQERLREHGIESSLSAPRLGEQRLSLRDPDGMGIELIEVARTASTQPWAGSDVPAECALWTFHGAVFLQRDAAPTIDLLVGSMGAKLGPSEGPWQRVLVGDGDDAAYIDIKSDPELPKGVVGAGSVHHIAWRVEDDEAQALARKELLAAGCFVSPVRDRNYFHSIYFREPGGILFEIATDPPGFLVDEAIDSLGSELRLPPQYEPHRARIEAALPPLK